MKKGDAHSQIIYACGKRTLGLCHQNIACERPVIDVVLIDDDRDYCLMIERALLGQPVGLGAAAVVIGPGVHRGRRI